jgi:hypothetical protein
VGRSPSASVFAAAVPPTAAAAVVPGATYTGTASDGASVEFTVSSDGTLIESYAIRNIHGTDVDGEGCLLFSAGDEGVWPGAPIASGAFDSSIGTEFDFGGSFPGPQSASGSFLIDNPAVGESTGCSTGTVNWTATTTATPPSSGNSGTPGASTPGGSTGSTGSSGSGGSGGSGSSGSSGSGGSGSESNSSHTAHRRSVSTKITFARRSARLLDGRLKAQAGACVARRTVYLWRGRKRVGHTRASSNGRFSFKVSPGMHGHAVRAAVKALTTKSVSCTGSSSTFIGA